MTPTEIATSIIAFVATLLGASSFWTLRQQRKNGDADAAMKVVQITEAVTAYMSKNYQQVIADLAVANEKIRALEDAKEELRRKCAACDEALRVATAATAALTAGRLVDQARISALERLVQDAKIDANTVATKHNAEAVAALTVIHETPAVHPPVPADGEHEHEAGYPPHTHPEA